MSSQKGFFPPVIIVIILTVFLIIGFGYVYFNGYINPTNQEKNTQNSKTSTENNSTQDIYQSPLGFSFKKPSSGNVFEVSFDTDNLGTNPDNNLVEPEEVNTTSSSLGTKITTVAYSLTVTKVSAVGTIPTEITSKIAYGGGDFFQFLQKNKSFYEEVQDLINKNIDSSNSKFFNDSGQIQRYGIVSYTNPESTLSGIKNFRISGFTVPGLGLFSEYYLFDDTKKYIIYIVSELACDEKDKLESEHRKYDKEDKNTYTIDSSFDGDEYIKTLHTISQDCEVESKYEANLKLLLSTIKFY